jgi:hypothetical protein
VGQFPSRTIALEAKPAAAPPAPVVAAAGQPLATQPGTEPAKAQPVTAIPAPPAGDTATCTLPGPVRDVASAGGGRYLLLTVTNPLQLAAYDMKDNRVVKSIPLIADDVFAAAGKTKFVVVSPGLNVIQRYDIVTLEREKDVPLPARTRTLGIGMGSLSEGPVFVVWQAASTQPQQQTSAQISFLDLDQLQAIKLHTVNAVDPKRANAQISLRDVKSFPVPMNLFHMVAARQSLQVFASAGGDLFTAQTFPSGLFVSIWNKPSGKAARQATPDFADQAPFLPCPDGRRILVGGGKVVDQYNKVITRTENASQNSPTLPTSDPAYWIRVSSPQMSQTASVSLLLPTGAVLLSVEFKGDSTPKGRFQPVVASGNLPTAERVHFDPSSHTLAYIPAQNDRIVWQKLDIEGAFTRLNDPIVVLSPTFVAAVAGQDFRHQIQVRSRWGPVKYRLSSEAPPGLAVTPEGLVTWKVPGKSDGREATAVIAASDGGGHEVTSVLKILIR